MKHILLYFIDFFGISRSAAQKCVKRWKEERTLEPKAKPGRPSLISNRDNSMMIRAIMKEPSISSSDLARDLNIIKNNEVSPATIRRHLFRSGLRWYTALKKPFLTKKMKQKRLEWCKKYCNKPIEFWENVSFSDETMIAINLNSVMNKIRRFKTQNSLDPRFLQKFVKYPLKQMFWGNFSLNGVGSLIPIDGIMNSNKYISILNDHLGGDMQRCNTNMFMDDSAPCHRSKKVLDWLKTKQIDTIDWPGNSPDLNPIENLWAILKRKLKMKPIRNRSDLIKAASNEWEKLPEDILKNLIYSIPNRIKEVIKKNGGQTKY